MATAARRELVIKGPTYFSEGDEAAFFNWLTTIPCVASVAGHLHNLHIHLKKPASVRDLVEFNALLRRYRISAAALVQLKNSRNARWFADMER